MILRPFATRWPVQLLWKRWDPSNMARSCHDKFLTYMYVRHSNDDSGLYMQPLAPAVAWRQPRCHVAGLAGWCCWCPKNGCQVMGRKWPEITFPNATSMWCWKLSFGACLVASYFFWMSNRLSSHPEVACKDLWIYFLYYVEIMINTNFAAVLAYEAKYLRSRDNFVSFIHVFNRP